MSLPPTNKNAMDILAYGGVLHRITTRIRQSLELQEILSATVAEIRSLLKTDRVKIYRFHPDGNGQVIAESLAKNRLPSLLGFNFPAEDIPLETRQMYIKAHQRSIVDVAAQQITLSRIEHPFTTGDLTLEDIHQQPISDILQRPVDPCHVNYLTGMGVMSSLVVPIIYQQQLWGLLVSHHAESGGFQEEDLQLIQLVADQLSIAIAQSELLSQTRSQVRQETLINQITPLLHSPRPMPEILQLVLERIVRAVQGSGGRLYLVATPQRLSSLHTCGIQPISSESGKPDWLEEYSLWRELMQTPASPSQSEDIFSLRAIADLYQDPQLAPLTDAFQTTPIRGMLVMPLEYRQESLGYLTIFRNAIDTETLWAGYWNRDQRLERPRASFEVWREQKKNQAPEWTSEELDLIQSLGIHLAMAIVQNQLYQLELYNHELSIARVVAEEASRLKSHFLASTSHELRTPLASTLNCLQILGKGFYKSENDLKKYLQLAEQSTKNLVSIINDVLDIAKIESGRMTVELEPVSLKPLLEEQQTLFSVEIEQKGISLISECEVDRVCADKGKLRQVLTNLLSNALKFTESGEVRIRANKPAERSAVEIVVTDTGIGIEMMKSEQLLEPFVQADGSIKRRYGGTGLGLAICKRLVELMGGQIRLYSAGKNQGTTVTVTLPYPINQAEGEVCCYISES
ncbi:MULTISPECIES: GAF domain-containing protein [unclassified Coleofasciculus]|uniref:GAF domain-containing protein n=1 Tax=unclassified Coleofasciculus TaxID=2692782 RepID=UPI0018823C2E|nr:MULTISPECIES: GAF domain-containing protein [unclassified Coleofasciculus]MBE9126275.1 GAF domain-containing protein [Coleofasciculus sp. LEGE 07081]MBE9149194.1 GAF domain-containing protein [Coleofasciculus sp. LEGE 07092]